MLYVNDITSGRLEALDCTLVAGWNGYQVLSSDDSAEPIVRVSFGGRGDGFTIDHLVFAASDEVPLAFRSWGEVKTLHR